MKELQRRCLDVHHWFWTLPSFFWVRIWWKDTRKIGYYGELWKLKGFIHLLQVDRTSHSTWQNVNFQSFNLKLAVSKSFLLQDSMLLILSVLCKSCSRGGNIVIVQERMLWACGFKNLCLKATICETEKLLQPPGEIV